MRIESENVCLVSLPGRLGDHVHEVYLAAAREPNWLACLGELLIASAGAARRGEGSLHQEPSGPYVVWLSYHLCCVCSVCLKKFECYDCLALLKLSILARYHMPPFTCLSVFLFRVVPFIYIDFSQPKHYIRIKKQVNTHERNSKTTWAGFSCNIQTSATMLEYCFNCLSFNS